MNLAVWSTTKPPEGGTLTGREPDNAADHAERRTARVPRLRGNLDKTRFIGSEVSLSKTHWNHERGRDAFHRVPVCWAKSGTEWNRSLPWFMKSIKVSPLFAAGLAGALFLADCALPAAAAATLPNVVLIYADDLGYGDLGCYGATRIQTPNIDRLAKEGLRFAHGYSAAATCTPSRYALMTGEYAWRRRGAGVLPGNAALIIEPGRTTLPSIFQKAGYRTGVVGKWHLGLGSGQIDWNGEIRPGPLDVGFDRCFILPATGDRVPCIYVNGRRVVNLDPADPIEVSYGTPLPGVLTGRDNPELLRLRPSHGHDQSIVNGISRLGYMKGGKAALWKDEEMADNLTRQAIRFIEAEEKKPFFLFFALHDPHVPRVPHPRFVGKTALGPRGDVIAQIDWCVGEVLAALDRLGLATNTLVVFTSDNGPVVDDGYRDQAVEKLADHKPSGPLRGGKYSKYEAGCRVPFIVRWPGRVNHGTSGAIVSQVDLVASMASMVGQTLAPTDAPDSLPVFPALLGGSPKGRDYVVEQGGGALALRRGNLKFIPANLGPQVSANTNVELGNSREPQLFDLANDPGERTNLAAAQPQVVVRLKEELQRIRGAGFTRPGAAAATPPQALPASRDARK